MHLLCAMLSASNANHIRNSFVGFLLHLFQTHYWSIATEINSLPQLICYSLHTIGSTATKQTRKLSNTKHTHTKPPMHSSFASITFFTLTIATVYLVVIATHSSIKTSMTSEKTVKFVNWNKSIVWKSI